MASQPMSPGSGDIPGYDIHREVLGAAATSDPVLIPAGARRVTVGVSSVGTGARIETTLDTLALIEAGTAQWMAWAAGDVSANTSDGLESAVTAVRAVAITGVATWHIVASNR
jgi:hypothetical protein